MPPQAWPMLRQRQTAIAVTSTRRSLSTFTCLPRMKLAAWTRTGSRVLQLSPTLFAALRTRVLSGSSGHWMSKPEPPAPPCPHWDATMKHVAQSGICRTTPGHVNTLERLSWSGQRHSGNAVVAERHIVVQTPLSSRWQAKEHREIT